METLPAVVGVALGLLVWFLGFKFVSVDRHWHGDYGDILTSVWNWTLRSFLGLSTLAATAIGLSMTISGHLGPSLFLSWFVPYIALVVAYFLYRYVLKSRAR